MIKTFSIPVSCCSGSLAIVTPVIPAGKAQQSPQAPPFDPNAVLATLKDLKAKQQTVVSREKSGVSANINAAIADPAKYDELAVTAVDLQSGSGNDGGNRVLEWRKRNAALLRNRDYIDALRQHLMST